VRRFRPFVASGFWGALGFGVLGIQLLAFALRPLLWADCLIKSGLLILPGLVRHSLKFDQAKMIAASGWDSKTETETKCGFQA
jgi:hypothetical protein